MHHQLKRGSGLRTSLMRDRRGIAYVNAACVPRSGVNDQGEALLHLSWAEFSGRRLSHLSHRWYRPDGTLVHLERLPEKESLVC